MVPQPRPAAGSPTNRVATLLVSLKIGQVLMAWIKQIGIRTAPNAEEILLRILTQDGYHTEA